MVRVKRRYFLFQIRFDSTNQTKTLKNSQIIKTFELMISRLYGDYGASRFNRNLSIVYYNDTTKILIIRSVREDKDLLQTSSTFLNKFIDEPCQCSIETLHISGSIRQTKKYLVNYSIEQLLEINRKSIEQNSSTIKTKKIFNKNKEKSKFDHRNSSKLNEQQREIILQKFLIDSRNESSSTIDSNNIDILVDH